MESKSKKGSSVRQEPRKGTTTTTMLSESNDKVMYHTCHCPSNKNMEFLVLADNLMFPIDEARIRQSCKDERHHFRVTFIVGTSLRCSQMKCFITAFLEGMKKGMPNKFFVIQIAVGSNDFVWLSSKNGNVRVERRNPTDIFQELQSLKKSILNFFPSALVFFYPVPDLSKALRTGSDNPNLEAENNLEKEISKLNKKLHGCNEDFFFLPGDKLRKDSWACKNVRRKCSKIWRFVSERRVSVDPISGMYLNSFLHDSVFDFACCMFRKVARNLNVRQRNKEKKQDDNLKSEMENPMETKKSSLTKKTPGVSSDQGTSKTSPKCNIDNNEDSPTSELEQGELIDSEDGTTETYEYNESSQIRGHNDHCKSSGDESQKMSSWNKRPSVEAVSRNKYEGESNKSHSTGRKRSRNASTHNIRGGSLSSCDSPERGKVPRDIRSDSLDRKSSLDDKDPSHRKTLSHNDRHSSYRDKKSYSKKPSDRKNLDKWPNTTTRKIRGQSSSSSDSPERGKVSKDSRSDLLNRKLSLLFDDKVSPCRRRSSHRDTNSSYDRRSSDKEKLEKRHNSSKKDSHKGSHRQSSKERDSSHRRRPSNDQDSIERMRKPWDKEYDLYDTQPTNKEEWHGSKMSFREDEMTSHRRKSSGERYSSEKRSSKRDRSRSCDKVREALSSDKSMSPRSSSSIILKQEPKSAKSPESDSSRSTQIFDSNKNSEKPDYQTKPDVSYTGDTMSISSSSSTVAYDTNPYRRDSGLSDLYVCHDKECKMYIAKPYAHPDYAKEKKLFTSSWVADNHPDGCYDPVILDWEWSMFWKTRMKELFDESWAMKKGIYRAQKDKGLAKRRKIQGKNDVDFEQYLNSVQEYSMEEKVQKWENSKKKEDLGLARRSCVLVPDEASQEQRTKSHDHNVSKGQEKELESCSSKHKPEENTPETDSQQIDIEIMKKVIGPVVFPETHRDPIINKLLIVLKVHPQLALLTTSLKYMLDFALKACTKMEDTVTLLEDEDNVIVLEMVREKVKSLLKDKGKSDIIEDLKKALKATEDLIAMSKSIKKPHFGLNLYRLAVATRGIKEDVIMCLVESLALSSGRGEVNPENVQKTCKVVQSLLK
ncbi:uncharacterized protein LOC143024954 isoform X2 [Oratosquilla oratoria]|uniref:uncharacterized protein LOC143024954 isoform X2 n=1 Tax=Oratosquilla oratoria TaxID=337810 RepID=UPI003F7632C1